MKYAINFANFGYLSNIKVLTDLAVDTENAGWDAVFLWDHVNLIFEGEEAGANWWIDSGNPATESLEALRARVRRGPPGR